MLDILSLPIERQTGRRTHVVSRLYMTVIRVDRKDNDVHGHLVRVRQPLSRFSADARTSSAHVSRRRACAVLAANVPIPIFSSTHNILMNSSLSAVITLVHRKGHRRR